MLILLLKDAGGPLVFPQAALSDFFVSSLKKLPDVVFTTNPFRLRWCNVKMVFFRENLISKMGRHCLFPKLLTNDDPPGMLVKTIMEQGHLCPMPQAVCPLYWNYDQAMYLYPIPDLVVLADSYHQFVVREKSNDRKDQYLACNPGSFSRDFSFIVIRPSTLEIEESRIPDGQEDEENMEEAEKESEKEKRDEESKDEEEVDEEVSVQNEEEENVNEQVSDEDKIDEIEKTQILPEEEPEEEEEDQQQEEVQEEQIHEFSE